MTTAVVLCTDGAGVYSCACAKRDLPLARGQFLDDHAAVHTFEKVCERGDVIGIGNRDCLYYCFPKPTDGKIPPVAKARLATEELYKMAMDQTRKRE